MSDQGAQLRELMQSLPWQSRVRLTVRWLIRSAVRRLPGYRFITFTLWKAKRGGWLGVFDPVFDIAKQDRAAHDRRLKWHRWGVLSEVGGFRAYTPTRRSGRCFATASEAWDALAAAYRGKPAKIEWEPAAHD